MLLNEILGFVQGADSLSNLGRKMRALFGRSSGVSFRIFPPRPGQRYNKKFYRHFRRVLKGAQEQIYITGDGFECLDKEGRKPAQRFHETFKNLLENKHVRVVRIQTHRRTSRNWAMMVSELLERFPDNFELFLLRSEKADAVNLCLIDSHKAEKAVVEMMVLSPHHFGTRSADLAGTGIFVTGEPNMARDLQGHILEMTAPDVSIPLSTPQSIRDHLCPEAYYFAYGSNMNLEQMQKRCDGARNVGVAYLDDYRIVFNRRGSYVDGGVASIEPAPGKRVYGLLWVIRAELLEALDRHEDPKAYERKELEVTRLEDESPALAHVYIAFPQEHMPAHPEYLELIIKAARAAKFPADYIRELEGFRLPRRLGKGLPPKLLEAPSKPKRKK